MQALTRLPSWALPLLIFAAALAVRLAVILHWGFDGLYGQDAFAYLDRATEIAHGLLPGGAQLTPFHWPNGYPFLAGLTILAVGEGATGPQLLNVLFGSLLAVLLALFARDLGRELTDKAGGEICALIAGLATVVAGQMVLSSVVVMSDIAGAFWLTLAAWSIVRMAREPHRWWWLPIAAAAGAAALVTRRAALLAGPAFAAVTLLELPQVRRTAVAMGLALAAALVIVAPEVLLFTHEDSLGGYFTDWRPGNAFARSFEVEQGIRSYRFPNWLFYANPFWHPALMSPFLGIFAILGAVSLWSRQRRTLVLLGGWFLASYLFIIAVPFQNLRFSVTLWPPAILLAAAGVTMAWSRWRRLSAALVALALVTAVIVNPWWLNRFIQRATVARAAAERAAELLPDGGRILAFDITAAIDHYTEAEVFELFTLDHPQLTRVCSGDEPVLLVVDRADIEARWRHHPPFEHLQRLETESSLEPVDRIGRWDLIRVRPRSNADAGEG